MLFTGLAEVCQNEPCLSVDDRPFQEIACSFKLRLLADKVTINFLTKSTLSNFPIKGITSHSFRQRLFFPILSGKERAVAFGNSRGTRLEDQLFQPENLEISSLIGGW